MKRILYDATDHEKRKASHLSVGKELQKLDEGFTYLLSIKRNRAIRSLSANNFFWMVINLYATATGHTKNEIDFMFRMARHWKEIAMPSSGEVIRVPKETHELDTKDFSAVINNLLQWGREEFPNVIVPRREDATYLDYMRIEDEYDEANAGF